MSLAAQTQAERAAAVLKGMILANEMPPGSNHHETELARMLGMSRTPVREAALILEAQGLVELRPRHGMRVLPLTVEDMEEIYQILIELEPLAAQLVAEAGRDQDDLVGLERCLDAMERALERDDRAAWAEADDRFHHGLVALSGNRRLALLVATYSDQVHRARMLTLHMRPAPVQSNADHRALFDAIRAGDGPEARRIHHAHRIRTKGLISDLLQRSGLSRF